MDVVVTRCQVELQARLLVCSSSNFAGALYEWSSLVFRFVAYIHSAVGAGRFFIRPQALLWVVRRSYIIFPKIRQYPYLGRDFRLGYCLVFILGLMMQEMQCSPNCHDQGRWWCRDIMLPNSMHHHVNETWNLRIEEVRYKMCFQ